jgi:hypothetical protein
MMCVADWISVKQKDRMFTDYNLQVYYKPQMEIYRLAKSCILTQVLLGFYEEYTNPSKNNKTESHLKLCYQNPLHGKQLPARPTRPALPTNSLTVHNFSY